MSKIFGAQTMNGILYFNNKEDSEAYFKSIKGIQLTVTIEENDKLTDKQKLYNYYHKVVLRQHALKAFRAAGYVCKDEVEVSYHLEAMFAKIYLKKPDGTFEIGIEPKHRMTKGRLLIFVVDVIHFLETEMGEMVSDSEEYKIWKATGKKLSKIK
jgi:hypothetical protein